MSKLVPSSVEPPQTADDDPRIGHLLGKSLSEGEIPRCVLIGFPSDEGVRRNHGRPGASGGTLAIRNQLYRMTPPPHDEDKFRELVGKTRDIGNIAVTMNLEAGQDDLGKVVADLLEAGTIPVILGGGHETAFGHFLGYAKSDRKTSILNIDAHADVRPLKEGKAHSGSPFFQALIHESGYCEKYLVGGLQPHSTAKAHLEFIEQHGGSYTFREETNVTSISGLMHEHDSRHLMVTFDLDAVDQAFAPGVSAPCVNGLHPDLWLTAAYLAGRHEKVTSFDISEMNPEYDRDSQTARLAALTIWHFLQGFSEREVNRRIANKEY